MTGNPEESTTDPIRRAAKIALAYQHHTSVEDCKHEPGEYTMGLIRALADAGMIATVPPTVYLAGTDAMNDEVYAVYATGQEAEQAAGSSRHRVTITAYGVVGAYRPERDMPCPMCGRLFTSVVHECCEQVSQLRAQLDDARKTIRARIGDDETARSIDAAEPPRDEHDDDQWRMAEWHAAPDVCLIDGCESIDTDQRGPIFLRDGSMHKACSDHWEAIISVLGRQAGSSDAARWQPSEQTEDPDRCPTSTRVDGPLHSTRFDGDDPLAGKVIP